MPNYCLVLIGCITASFIWNKYRGYSKFFNDFDRDFSWLISSVRNFWDNKREVTLIGIIIDK